jgi:acetate kinase
VSIPGAAATPAVPTLAVINAGSSSIKFALFTAAPLERLLDGTLNLAGSQAARLTFTDRTHSQPQLSGVEIPAAASASGFLVDWMRSLDAFQQVHTVGHRVVHGMQHSEPAVLSPPLLQELRNFQPFDPEHLPLEIELIEAFTRRSPDLRQLLCFDTAFHRGMPRVATLLPIPRHFEQQGIRRYGFHGLSYTYLMEELTRLGDPAAATGRVILAHLGNGASMAAVLAGVSIDTSMGFTPASGLMMGTRSGELDPGLISFMSRTGQLTPAQFDRMVNRESGLLGVSQLSADVRELLALEARDIRAAEALALFCYQSRKCIGAYAAVLGGLDTLAFAGGIGENSPAIRERICAGLQFLGVRIDSQRNAGSESLISPDGAPVSVRVIRTDEELIVARACAAVHCATHTGLDS